MNPIPRRRAADLLRASVYGPDRRPLEPARPLPWLLRALSWVLVAAALTALSPVAVLIAAGRLSAAGDVASLGVLLGVLAFVVRFAAGLARPSSVLLKPVDES